MLSAEAGPAEKYAAANLQSVFQKMTGVRLAIAGDDRSIEGNRILIGNTRFTDAVVPANERKTLDKEGYIVRLHGRDRPWLGEVPTERFTPSTSFTIGSAPAGISPVTWAR